MGEEAAGRRVLSIVSLDRSLTVASLLFGIVGAAPALYFLFTEQVVGGLLILGIATIIVSAVLAIRWLVSQPPFTLINVDKTLSFEADETADRATHEDVRKVQANHRGLPEFWFKDIGPEAAVDNVRLDGEMPNVERTQANSSKGVGKRFDPGLEWRQRFVVQLTNDIVGAFPARTEYYTHKVMDKTKRLRIKVKFHSNKKCHGARVCLGYGGAPFQQLRSPQLKNRGSGKELELEVKRPKLGQEYRLEWDW